MHTRFLGTALLCISACAAQAQETPLFRLQSDAASAGGQPAMVFQEVARDETTSTVELLHASGSVLGKSMFMLKGGCGLMQERGMPGFTVEPVSRQPLRVLLRFSSAEQADRLTKQPLQEGGLISAAHCGAIATTLARQRGA